MATPSIGAATYPSGRTENVMRFESVMTVSARDLPSSRAGFLMSMGSGDYGTIMIVMLRQLPTTASVFGRPSRPHACFFTGS